MYQRINLLPPPHCFLHSFLSQGLISRGPSYGSGAEKNTSTVKIPSVLVNEHLLDTEKATITKASSQYLDTYTLPPQVYHAPRPMSAPGFLANSGQTTPYHQQNGFQSSEWHSHETAQEHSREEVKHSLGTTQQKIGLGGAVQCPNCAVMFPRRPELFQKCFEHIASCGP